MPAYGDGHVKLLVGLGHVKVIAGFHRCLEFFLAAGDDLQISIGPQFCRQPRIHALGYIECFNIFREDGDLYWGNDRASIGKCYNQVVSR